MFQELTALAITDDTFRREIYLDCTVGPAQSRIYMESVNKIKIEGIDISFKVQDSRFSEIVFDIIVTLVWQKDSQVPRYFKWVGQIEAFPRRGRSWRSNFESIGSRAPWISR
ncbi:MAG: hypothetical protein EOM06_15335, partial [Sphingobacteriia bacterium]|nr:hypothetical protein [Sphingobacteriia bacterium]